MAEDSEPVLASVSSTNSWKRPMALEPPPTQASRTSGLPPNWSRHCCRTSLPMTAWKSRTWCGGNMTLGQTQHGHNVDLVGNHHSDGFCGLQLAALTGTPDSASYVGHTKQVSTWLIHAQPLVVQPCSAGTPGARSHQR